MKKVIKLMLAVTMLTGVSGCKTTDSNENIEESAKDILVKSFDLYNSYSGYQVNIYGKSNGLTNENNKIDVTPMSEAENIIKEVKKGDEYYSVADGKSKSEHGTTPINKYEIKIKNQNEVFTAWFSKEDRNNVRLIYVGTESRGDFKDDEYTYKIISKPILFELYDHYLNKYTEFFNFNKEITDDKIKIKVTCKDYEAFTNKIHQEIKEHNPDYDPYTMFDLKVSKNEITKRECTFTLDSNYNPIRIEDVINYDYGDGLTTSSVVVSEIQQINNINMKTEKIDALLKEAEAVTNENGVVDSDAFGLRNDIDWDFN